MKSCELCKCMARIYCESDQASLCWTCDAKVHSANFLVARHLRSLLCHSCQSPTPWSASGEKLGRTVTLCVGCVDGCHSLKEGERERTDESRGNDDESESEYDSDEDDDDDEDRLDDDEEDDGENQVVPWSSTSPPPAASSSESEEFSTGNIEVSSKRSRENDGDLSSKDDFSCSTSRRNNQMITSETAAARRIRGGEDAFVGSLYFRPLKMRIFFFPNRAAGVKHTSATETIVEALERFHEQGMTYSSNKASEAVDLDLSECP